MEKIKAKNTNKKIPLADQLECITLKFDGGFGYYYPKVKKLILHVNKDEFLNKYNHKEQNIYTIQYIYSKRKRKFTLEVDTFEINPKYYLMILDSDKICYSFLLLKSQNNCGKIPVTAITIE